MSLYDEKIMMNKQHFVYLSVDHNKDRAYVSALFINITHLTKYLTVSEKMNNLK